jgi:hypothetical protein
MLSDFCTPSGTGPPGAAAPGSTGCISNCGTEIVSGSAPATFISVAYFEGWNPSWPYLRLDVGQIDDTKYMHVHFGFGALSANNYQVDISSDTQSQFARFTSLKTRMKNNSLDLGMDLFHSSIRLRHLPHWNDSGESRHYVHEYRKLHYQK